MCLFEGEGSLPRAEAVPWLGEAEELSQPLRARWQQGSDLGGFGAGSFPVARPSRLPFVFPGVEQPCANLVPLAVSYFHALMP